MNNHGVIIDNAIRRNPAEFAVLGALDGQDSHGYRLITFLQDNLAGVCWLGRSQIYALLTKLEHEGLVKFERMEQENFPARKVYELTTQGRNVLNEWLLKPVSYMRDLRVEFLIKLFFARLKSTTVEQNLLKSQLDLCEAKLSRLIKIKSRTSSKIVEEAIDYRISMAQASIFWLETLTRKQSARNSR
ncbi:MAG: PadR family transcriptional regulator [Deltaproteobacteria bacterium]|jgi:DNA-binding PadR family transcriptional regulator|nr:PadR family transcriptional regulator [Deltaproteobacteria bacterium]